MTLARVVAVVAGIVGAAWFVTSAVRTVVMPRPERVWLTMTSFEIARRASRAVAGRIADPVRRHRVLGAFAPSVLISLPLIWAVGLVASFAAIYWGLDVGSFADAVELSGSSLTTLGFVAAPTFATRLIAILEALIDDAEENDRDVGQVSIPFIESDDEFVPGTWVPEFWFVVRKVLDD
jgi:hypothetical protein